MLKCLALNKVERLKEREEMKEVGITLSFLNEVLTMGENIR